VSLTVACVWVDGHLRFSEQYVTKLRSMVARYLKRPHRFVCLSDQDYQAPGIETQVIPPVMRGIKGWWSKIHLFDPGRFKGRVLYLDLDTLIVDALDPIVDWPSPFALVPDAGTFRGRMGLKVVKRFNSSVMVWDAGVPDRLSKDWRQSVMWKLWGDQDWIGQQMPKADIMPVEWFPRLSQCLGGPPDGAKVILAKMPKNEEAATRHPWFAERWK
jgi:hypothetical protein